MTLEEIEQSTEGQVIARRNFAIGLWAGRQIGHRGQALANYVRDVMRADHDIPGPDDLVDKIQADFIVHNIALSSQDILYKVDQQERLTRMKMRATN